MKTVMIVEDEAALRTALKDHLQQAGFATLTAKDGEEGVSLALAKHPNLILLDILMPKKDGLTMLKELREDAWGKTAEVIILSNFDDNQDIAEALGSNVHVYMSKASMKLEDLTAEINKILQ